jgi:hypothetical protein
VNFFTCSGRETSVTRLHNDSRYMELSSVAIEALMQKAAKCGHRGYSVEG